MKPKTIIILVFILLFVILLIQNTRVAGFRILFWEFEMSRIILYPVILLIGFILGFILGIIKKKKKNEDQNP